MRRRPRVLTCAAADDPESHDPVSSGPAEGGLGDSSSEESSEKQAPVGVPEGAEPTPDPEPPSGEREPSA